MFPPMCPSPTKPSLVRIGTSLRSCRRPRVRSRGWASPQRRGASSRAYQLAWQLSRAARNSQRASLHLVDSFHARRRLRGCARFETRMQLLLPELEETVIVRECNDRDPVESGPRPLLDRLDVSGDVRTTGNGLCYVVLAHIRRRGLEVDRVGQLGLHLPSGHAEPEQIM